VWSFSIPGPPPYCEIVSNVKNAAIIVYNYRHSLPTTVEPDRKQYKLYEINLETKEHLFVEYGRQTETI
jgi:hypothetical protein